MIACAGVSQNAANAGRTARRRRGPGGGGRPRQARRHNPPCARAWRPSRSSVAVSPTRLGSTPWWTLPCGSSAWAALYRPRPSTTTASRSPHAWRPGAATWGFLGGSAVPACAPGVCSCGKTWAPRCMTSTIVPCIPFRPAATGRASSSGWSRGTCLGGWWDVLTFPHSHMYTAKLRTDAALNWKPHMGAVCQGL